MLRSQHSPQSDSAKEVGLPDVNSSSSIREKMRAKKSEKLDGTIKNKKNKMLSSANERRQLDDKRT